MAVGHLQSLGYSEHGACFDYIYIIFMIYYSFYFAFFCCCRRRRHPRVASAYPLNFRCNSSVTFNYKSTQHINVTVYLCVTLADRRTKAAKEVPMKHHRCQPYYRVCVSQELKIKTFDLSSVLWVYICRKLHPDSMELMWKLWNKFCVALFWFLLLQNCCENNNERINFPGP